MLNKMSLHPNHNPKPLLDRWKISNEHINFFSKAELTGSVCRFSGDLCFTICKSTSKRFLKRNANHWSRSNQKIIDNFMKYMHIKFTILYYSYQPLNDDPLGGTVNIPV